MLLVKNPFILSLFILITLTSKNSFAQNHDYTITQLASVAGALTEKEAAELLKLKAEAKEEGLSVPSRESERLAELTLKTVMFQNQDHSNLIKETDEKIQFAYDQSLLQAMKDWEDTHASQDGARFVDFRLISITKSGFKVRFSLDTTDSEVEQLKNELNNKYENRGGACTVHESNTQNATKELKLICLNLTFRRVGETSVDEVKKITSSVRGHDTQAGGKVCTASGCGSFKTVTVRQMNASSSRTVKTGKKIQKTQIRQYNNWAEIE